MPRYLLLTGDCLALMAHLKDASIDLILADLPYGTTSNKWDSVLDLKQLWHQYLRVVKPNAAIVLTASQPFTSQLVMSRADLFKHEWIWLKNRGSNFANTVREPMKEHESVLVFSRGGWCYNKQMQERTGSGADRVKYNVAFKTKSENYRAFEDRETNRLPELRVPSSWQKFNTDTSGLHPTQKPVDLMRYLIRTYTNPDQVVLDNTMGVGSTGVACLLEGRRFIGMEINSEYVAVAERRMQEAPK